MATANQRYKDTHYSEVRVWVLKDTKQQLVEYAKSKGFKSLTEFVCYCLEKETGIRCRLNNPIPWMEKQRYTLNHPPNGGEAE